MPTNKTREAHQPTFLINQDDKFFSRLMAKENSMANASFRVYYGVAAGEVPFVWESRPGTPKHPISTANLSPLTPPPSCLITTNLPPLTPPPSYLFTTEQTLNKKKHNFKLKPLMSIIPKLTKKINPVISTSSSSNLSNSSSSSSSSSFGSWSCPPSPVMKHGFSSEEDPSTSTVCFKVLRHNFSGGFQRSYTKTMLKKTAMRLHILRHG